MIFILERKLGLGRFRVMERRLDLDFSSFRIYNVDKWIDVWLVLVDVKWLK